MFSDSFEHKGWCWVFSSYCFFQQDDVSYAGYEKHIQSKLGPAPLTMAEEEHVKLSEVCVGFYENVFTESSIFIGYALWKMSFFHLTIVFLENIETFSELLCEVY